MLKFSGYPLNLSIVDNLICVHMLEVNVTIVYDIASEGDRPIAHPMPLVCAPLAETADGYVDDISKFEKSPYDKTWLYAWPHWALRGRSGKVQVWNIRVNLVEAIHSGWGSSPGVLTAFLMRRSSDGYRPPPPASASESKETASDDGPVSATSSPGNYVKNLLLQELLKFSGTRRI